jgi:hypothetical protein
MTAQMQCPSCVCPLREKTTASANWSLLRNDETAFVFPVDFVLYVL